MSSPNENRPLFANLPRRRGLAAVPVVALWLGLAIAFALEVAPLRSPQDRFYELEAQRDFYVRAAATARQQHPLMVDAGAGAPVRVAHSARPAVQARTPARPVVVGMPDLASGVLAPQPCQNGQ